MDLNDDQPIHNWFNLTYASYLVFPRSVLQSLPQELQAQLVAALQAIEDHLRDYQRRRRRIGRNELHQVSRQLDIETDRHP